VSDYFYSPERLLVTDRIRYDSPILLKSVQFTSSIAADQRWDAGVQFTPSIEKWLFKTIFTYEHKPLNNFKNRISSMASVKHKYTGLSTLVGFSFSETYDGNRKPWGYNTKLGWERQFLSLGSTAFSIDYAKGNDIYTLSETASSFGIFFQQTINLIDLDFYLGYRQYNANPSTENLFTLKTYTFGLIYSFSTPINK